MLLNSLYVLSSNILTTILLYQYYYYFIVKEIEVKLYKFTKLVQIVNSSFKPAWLNS